MTKFPVADSELFVPRLIECYSVQINMYIADCLDQDCTLQYACAVMISISMD